MKYPGFDDGPVVGVAGARLQLARLLAALALFLLPALLLSTPFNLLPFGVLLAASSVLGIDRLWQARAATAGTAPALAALAVGVLALVALSASGTERPLSELDTLSRLLVMPWIVLWVMALRPPMRGLWWGAWSGLFATLALAVFQAASGWDRSAAWTNAIVLADVSLVLMIVLVFCRPPARWGWIVLGLVAGGAVILLSGSRGVWPALLALLLAMALSVRRGSGRLRLTVLAGAVLAATMVLLMVPQVREHTRLAELHSDVQRIERGDVNSSAGARLERWQVAWDTFREQPWTGVGIGQFDRAMQRLPACRLPEAAPERCHLGHAHNDAAEWAATLGIPGLLALLGIYGLPLWLFIGLHRRSGENGFRGPAAAGIMLVVAYVVCGLTQSMFAHQITASTYAVLVGLLAGLSLSARDRRHAQASAQG